SYDPTSLLASLTALQKSVKDIREIKMEHARKQQVPKETITSSDTTTLVEFDQKTTLFETMTKPKSFNKSLKKRSLYHALMESILEDEDAIDEGVAEKLKKRKQDDADKDEGPSTGLDLRLKRRKTSKDTKPSKKAKSTESSKGTSKSQPKSSGKSAQADEIVFEAGDTQEPHNQGQDMGTTDDQPNVEAAPKHDWFKKPKRPSNLDLNLNKLSNLERDVIFDLGVALRMFTKRIVILKRVTVLHDIALNLRMDYLPKKRWSSLDRKRSHSMIKDIDQLQLERRLMKRLKNFVGEKDYEEDLKLIERTI
nr:hypothetical protein [Tanacetum cinerariifolium]